MNKLKSASARVDESEKVNSTTKAEILCSDEAKPSKVEENKPSPISSLSYVLIAIPAELNKLIDRIYATEESLRKSLI